MPKTASFPAQGKSSPDSRPVRNFRRDYPLLSLVYITRTELNRTSRPNYNKYPKALIRHAHSLSTYFIRIG